MSIKKKIQQSMTVILTVTLVLAYVILSVILYNRNMNLLQTCLLYTSDAADD